MCVCELVCVCVSVCVCVACNATCSSRSIWCLWSSRCCLLKSPSAPLDWVARVATALTTRWAGTKGRRMFMNTSLRAARGGRRGGGAD